MKKIFYLLPLMALASCTSNDIVENPAPVYGTEEIQLNGGIITSESGPVSRAILSDVAVGGMDISILRQDADPTSGTLPANFTVGGLKTAFVFDGATSSGAATPAKGTVAFGTSSAITHEYYLANGKDTRLFAWYPQITPSPVTDVTYSAGTVTFNNLDGYVDVMASKAVEGSKSAKITSIVLKHMLTQLQFKAYESTAGAKDMWGKITKIEVLDVEPTCAVTLDVDKANDPTITYSGTVVDLTVCKADKSAVGNVDMATYTTDETTTKGLATDCGVILVPTKVAGATKMKIKVYTEKHTAGKEVDLDNASAYGSSQSNIVYLKFTSEEILPTVTISPWAAGTNQEVEM